jgi:hypothetical protein
MKSKSISFGDALCILFIALKLCKVIDWSWVWVLSPLWISIVLMAGICVIRKDDGK